MIYLEYICRHTRKHKKYFGSLQVIVIGDFFQLPPVPDLLKGDKGQYCFLSEKFQNIFQKHFVVLTDVLRQTEVDFITCINEVSKGTLLSEESLALLQRMKRPLPPGPPPVRLCAKKFDCDVFNASKLFDFPGEAKCYAAEDSGKKKYLNNMPVPEILYLKLNCPVLLLKNLSDHLVNGLKGKVTGLANDEVSVYFEGLSKDINIHSIFSVKRTSGCNPNSVSKKACFQYDNRQGPRSHVR